MIPNALHAKLLLQHLLRPFHLLNDGYPDHTQNDIEPLLLALVVLPIPHPILFIVPIRSRRRVHAPSAN